MSDSAQLAAAPSFIQPAPTPLAAHLLATGPSSGPPLELASHGGAETSRRFTEPSAELSALLHAAAVYDLGYRTRIAVTGEDRLRWLNGMVSNAVQSLAEGNGNYNLILNAQGRIQGDAYIYRAADRLLFDTERSQAAHLIAHLDHFIIMDDVELRPLDASALGLAGPESTPLLTHMGLDVAGLEPLQFTSAIIDGISVTVVRGYEVLVPRYELWFEPQHTAALWSALLEAGAIPAGVDAIESLRILEGTPRYGVDIPERLLPQETALTRALNFNKGCYLGQEIVERIRSRATIHRRLAHFALQGSLPSTGAELHVAGSNDTAVTEAAQKAAELYSIASYSLPGLPQIVAIGLARVESLERRLPLAYDGGTATLLDQPPPIPPG